MNCRIKEQHMVDPVTRRTFVRASGTLAVVMALGLGGILAGCADIHPEGDDPEEGMMGSPTDEVDHLRETEEREDEGGEEGRK
jgi:hypothetical protein